MSIVLQGSTSGSITLQEPAVAGTTVLSLPATSGTLITTGSSGQAIPKAALPTGSVLQVVNTVYATATTTTSTTYQASGVTASITPTSSSSKILVSASVPYDTYGGTLNQASLTLYRDATNLMTNGFSLLSGGSGLNIQPGSPALNWLDSPATTSSTIYTIYFRVTTNSSGSVTARICVDNYSASITLQEIAA